MLCSFSFCLLNILFILLKALFIIFKSCNIDAIFSSHDNNVQDKAYSNIKHLLIFLSCLLRILFIKFLSEIDVFIDTILSP